jgi:hypothetical protein
MSDIAEKVYLNNLKYLQCVNLSNTISSEDISSTPLVTSEHATEWVGKYARCVCVCVCVFVCGGWGEG